MMCESSDNRLPLLPGSRNNFYRESKRKCGSASNEKRVGARAKMKGEEETRGVGDAGTRRKKLKRYSVSSLRVSSVPASLPRYLMASQLLLVRNYQLLRCWR